ncbi:glycosyltransferase [Candidatus Peribacteria bacterium]|nr:glycosyltransferase [Candidatus Peribacteria bacterium]
MNTSQEPRRILTLTPWVPFPVTGACQQDRFAGMQQMKALGYEISVIAKIHHFQDATGARSSFAKEGIPLTLVEHPRHPWMLLFMKFFSILKNPALLDGAALEYTDPAYERVVIETVERFKPDLVWMEYSSHWPVLRLLKNYGIPMIVKSSLNEPQNCIDEHGGSLLSRLKSLPKHPGERIAAQESDLILAISPDEEKFYAGLGAKRTGVMPLRGLSKCFVKKNHEKKEILDVVFLSSNYNMGHNRDALVFLLTKIVPLVREKLPGKVRFHLTGKKFPKQYESLLGPDVRTTGYIEDLGAFLLTMDAALCPWISGTGMQQKVFEPLCRSLPLLTTKTAGYPFENGKEVLLCKTPEEYVAGLEQLFDPAKRNELAENAYRKAFSLFSEDAVKRIFTSTIERICTPQGIPARGEELV